MCRVQPFLPGPPEPGPPSPPSPTEVDPDRRPVSPRRQPSLLISQCPRPLLHCQDTRFAVASEHGLLSPSSSEATVDPATVDIPLSCITGYAKILAIAPIICGQAPPPTVAMWNITSIWEGTSPRIHSGLCLQYIRPVKIATENSAHRAVAERALDPSPIVPARGTSDYSPECQSEHEDGSMLIGSPLPLADRGRVRPPPSPTQPDPDPPSVRNWTPRNPSPHHFSNSHRPPQHSPFSRAELSPSV
jgi:hypothetical protein